MATVAGNYGAISEVMVRNIAGYLMEIQDSIGMESFNSADLADLLRKVEKELTSINSMCDSGWKAANEHEERQAHFKKSTE